MCGIFGAITEQGLEEERLRKISQVLSHRGPDDSGVIKIELQNKTIDLVHRRLSIIDLSSRAHQPMCNENQSLWIVYNGEVYNFLELRQELIKKGYKFSSNSDTEVVLKSYQEWSIDCIKKFNGMFAFAIVDKIKNKLFLFRDHAGIKPLYYYENNGIFMFSSELKSFMQLQEFKKNIDRESLYLYLLFGYIPSPYTIFQNTYKLEPGFILEKDLSGNIKKIKWWNIFEQYKKEKLDISFDEAKEILKEKLIRAFKYRLISDVPLGIFLSGGIDSTLLVALLQKNTSLSLKTFTIGFYESEYNEANWAKRIANYLNTKHTEFFCTPKEAFEVVKEIPLIYDEPFADSSGIPTYLVSKLSRQYVKVCLSGDGGDELFGGYDRYVLMDRFLPFLNLPLFMKKQVLTILSNLAVSFYKKIKKEFTSDKIFKLKGILNSNNFKTLYLNQIFYWTPLELTDLLSNKMEFPLDIFTRYIPDSLTNKEKMMSWDFYYYLSDDLFTKVDRASMYNSLEVRDTFVDRELCEFIVQLPLKYRFKKRILKSILKDYLPKEYFLRPKQGFAVPIHRWFRKELKDFFYYYFSESKLKQHRLFNCDYIKQILDIYIKTGDFAIHKLWALLVFQMWYEEHLNN